MPTYRFTANVPTRVEIDFIDVVGGEYGPQVRINGKFAAAGEELTKAYGYLPGKAPDSLTELLRAGVIGDMPGAMPEGKEAKPLAVKPLAKSITVTAMQPAGQKYATTRAEVIGARGAAPQATPYAHPAPPRDDLPHVETGGPPPGASPHSAPQGHGTTPTSAPCYGNALYVRIVEFVRDVVVPTMPIEPSPESFAAMVNTLFISESKR